MSDYPGSIPKCPTRTGKELDEWIAEFKKRWPGAFNPAPPEGAPLPPKDPRDPEKDEEER